MRQPVKSEGLSFPRPNFGQGFFREAWAELKRVTWPKKATTIRLTVIVIAVSIFVSAYIGTLDLGLTKLIQGVLLK